MDEEHSIVNGLQLWRACEALEEAAGEKEEPKEIGWTQKKKRRRRRENPYTRYTRKASAIRCIMRTDTGTGTASRVPPARPSALVDADILRNYLSMTRSWSRSCRAQGSPNRLGILIGPSFLTYLIGNRLNNFPQGKSRISSIHPHHSIN